MWLKLWVIALVATTAWRLIFDRTKNTSRIGPETPAVSDSAEQTAPHANGCPRRSTFRCSLSGRANVMNGVSPMTMRATGLLTTTCSAVNAAVARSAPRT